MAGKTWGNVIAVIAVATAALLGGCNAAGADSRHWREDVIGSGGDVVLSAAGDESRCGGLAEEAQDLGTLTPGRSATYSFDLALDPGGRPIIARDDAFGGLYVDRWDGRAWRSLGGRLEAHAASDHVGAPAIAARGGRIVVAWPELANWPAGARAYAAEWNGARWVILGGGAIGDGETFGVDLVLDRDGSPVVAWTERVGNRATLHAARWNGWGWTRLGRTLDAGPGDRSDELAPSLAVDADGRVVVAWTIDAAVGPAGVERAATAVDACDRVTTAWIDDVDGRQQLFVRQATER